MIGALLTGLAIFMQAQVVLPPTREKPAAQVAGAMDTTTTLAPRTVSPVTVTPGKRQEAPPAVAQNRLVCRDELPIGSLLPVKVCAQAAEIDDRTKRDQDAVRTWQKGAITGKQP